jgi:hypothetical protein
MFRQFLPDHGPEGLSRTDKALTALRMFALIAQVCMGFRIGVDYLAGAWLGGDSIPQRLLGSVIGMLLGALVFVLIDAPAWTSGRRQEAYELNRVAVRAARAAQQAATTRNAPPAARSGKAAATRPVGPGRQAQARRSPAGDPRAAGAVVDERPAAPRYEPPSAELLDAVVMAVAAAGPRGALKQEVGDRLIGLGHDPTPELLTSCLTLLADRERRVSCVEDPAPGWARRWYDPIQLRVTRELVDQVVEVVTATGTDPVDVDAIRSGLLRLGADPSAPALDRVLRVLVADGVLVEAYGGYVRSGL